PTDRRAARRRVRARPRARTRSAPARLTRRLSPRRRLEQLTEDLDGLAGSGRWASEEISRQPHEAALPDCADRLPFTPAGIAGIIVAGGVVGDHHDRIRITRGDRLEADRRRRRADVGEQIAGTREAGQLVEKA